jgi:hypothetical protein
MLKTRKTLRAFGSLGIAVLLLAPHYSAQADTYTLPSAVTIPSQGQTTIASDVGSGQVSQSGGALVVRPSLPASPFFSTSLEYESWGNGQVDGFNRIKGNRVAGLFQYNKGGEDQTEIGVTVPYQRVVIDGLGHSNGVGDIGLAFRKYFYDANNPDSLTIIASVRGTLPTGDEAKALGLGRATFGPSLSLAKPIGSNLLTYAGVGYNFASGRSLGIDLDNAFYAWVGGVNRFSSRLGLQTEVTFFETPYGEKYTRIQVGPQLYLTPTQFVQLNFRKELKAAGKPFGVTLGYSSQF